MSSVLRRNAGEARPGRWLRLGIRTLLVLVAVCGGSLWVARSYLEARDPVRTMARMLRTGSAPQRVVAADVLGRLGAPNLDLSLRSLFEAMERDERAEVRAASAVAVGRLAALVPPGSLDEGWVDQAISALVRALTDPRAEVRAAAAGALGSLYESLKARPPAEPAIVRESAPRRAPDVIEALAARLRDRDDLVRLRAAEALRHVCPFASLDPPVELLSAISNEPSVDVRAAAILASRGFPSGVDDILPRLFRAYEEGKPKVGSACSAVLFPMVPSSRLVPFLIERLDSPNRNVRWMAANTLGRMSAAVPAIPKLIELLDEPAEDALPRGPNWSLISGADPSFTDPACRACWALGRLGPGSAVESEVVSALSRTASTPPGWRQVHAVEALGGFDASALPAVPALIAALKQAIETPGESVLGERAATALGKIAPETDQAPAAMAALLGAARPENDRIGVRAVLALGQFGPAALPAVPRLDALRDGPEPSLREAATDALEAIHAGR
jgi:HEAT repeat protein